MESGTINAGCTAPETITAQIIRTVHAGISALEAGFRRNTAKAQAQKPVIGCETARRQEYHQHKDCNGADQAFFAENFG